MSVKPAGKSSPPVPATFEIKSAQLSAVAVLVKSAPLSAVTHDLQKRFGPGGESPGFFDGDAAVLDFTSLDREAVCEGLEDFVAMLKDCQLVPVAMRGAPSHWLKPLQALGLVDASADVAMPKDAVKADTVVHAPAPVQKPVQQMPVPSVAAATTLVVDKPLRSGQKVYARGADLIVLAMVNQGAEVVADGNIHVYAPLRGKAMAGARGNTLARIFSTCLEPELISIAGVYRTSEVPLPKDIAGKPAQVRLSSDGQEKLIIEPLKT